MAIRTEEAWRKAAACALLAEQAGDDVARGALIKLRNSWIMVANDAGFLGFLDSNAVLGLHPDDAAPAVPDQSRSAATRPIQGLRPQNGM
jgi:hypothetical protein